MSSPLFHMAVDTLLLVLAVSLLLCFIRLLLGPDAPNRIAAFDLIAIHAVGIMVLSGVRNNAVALLDAAIITAVLGFLGSVMLARYLERSAADGGGDGSELQRNGGRLLRRHREPKV